MKKLLSMFVAIALMGGMCSCGDDTVLSASSAKKAIKKEAMFAKDYAVTQFETGYYEVNGYVLDNLAKLAAAGVVEYNVETVNYRKRMSKYDFWRGYIYYFVDAKATFANVSLTSAGQKYVVENPTVMREDLRKDFAANEDYEEKIPEYMSAYYNADETPAEETIVEETVVEEVVDSAVVADSVATQQVAVEVEEPVNNAPDAAYQAALDKVNIEIVNVLLGRYEVEKVKEVRCTEDMAQNGEGTCTALIIFTDKTPFGFVYGAPAEDYIMASKVSLKYYNDMGWVVSQMDK